LQLTRQAKSRIACSYSTGATVVTPVFFSSYGFSN
jgi:hypothetical protein